MWNNALDSDMVKGFVSLGTELIKIIDKIGLLNTALIALATISMIKNKMGPIAFLGGISDLIRELPGEIINFAKSFVTIPTAATASAKAIQGLTVASFQQSLASAGVAESNQAALLSQMGLTEANAAHVIGQQTLNASTLAAAVNNGTLTATQAAQLASVYGLTGAIAGLNAAQMSQALIAAGVSREQRVAIIQSLGLGAATKQLTADEVINTLTTAGMSSADSAAIAAKLGLTTANTGLAASFMALWKAMWPILAVMAGVAVIYGIVKLIDRLVVTTEELAEELNELKSELQDIESEIDSINDELETTQSRMAELLAMDNLSFAEEEELDRLRKQNDELQRQIDLLKLAEEQKTEEVAKKFVETMQSDVSDGTEYYIDSGKIKKTTFWTYLAEGALNTIFTRTSESEYIDQQIQAYQRNKDQLDRLEQEIIDAGGTDTKKGKQLSKEKARIEKDQEKIKKYIGDKISEFNENSEGLEYYTGDNLEEWQKESNEWLDYVNNTQDQWAIASGGDNAKTNALNRIFNKEEYAEASDEIDKLVEKLAKNPDDQNIISQISEKCKLAEKDLKAVGLSVQDATDYFTKLGTSASYNTIDGKIKEIDEATKRLNNVLGNVDTSSVDSIKQALTDKGWVDTEGNLMSDVIAEYFGGENGGISEETRAEIERLVKQIYDGKISVKDALKSFELFGVQSVIEIQVEEVKTNFKDVFVELEDADGLINTFEELGEAIGSTVGALEAFNQAQADVADKGFVSIQTALQLMEYTDDYGSVLQVVDGKLQLAKNAEQNLIQARINAIKVSAQTAVADAQAAYDKADLAVQSYSSAMVEEASASTVATAWQKIVAVAAGIKNALDNIWSDKSIGDLYQAGYDTYLESVTGDKTVYDDAGLQALKDSLSDAEDTLNEAKGNAEIANALTIEDLENMFESSDSKSPEDAKKKKIDDGWEKLISEYENKLALLSNERDLIQAEIDKAEARGGKASAKYYEDLIANSNDEKALLEQKKRALEEYLEANAGSIDQDTWTEYNNEINETAVAIKECETNTLEWAEAIREIDWHYFEQASDEISRLGEELEFVNGLLEDEDVADENGNWSSAALTRMGMYTNQMELAAAEAARYQDEIDELNEQYEKGELSEQQYQESLSDLVSGQQDAIQSYEDAKDSIVEMNEARIDAIKEGIEKEIEAYEDLIDAKKEELDAERDLYDFRKNIKNQTKDIAELERRIASLSGSSAASDVAERRKLEAQLMDAKEGLNDTYYDHSRDAQSAALDEEAEAYTLSKEKYIEQLEEQLKDTETLIENSIMDVMLNADTVYTKLNELADLYGVDLSDSLTLPWKNASAQAIKWKDELKESMTSGEYAALIGEGGAVTAFANGVATKLQGSWTAAQTAAKNYAGYLTGAELRNKFTNTLTGFGNQIQNIIDKWNGVKDAADAAYTAQTRKVTVGGTGTGATSGDGDSGSSGGGGTTAPQKAATPKPATAYLKIGNTVYSATGTGESLSLAKTAATGNVIQKAYNAYRAMGYDDSWIDKRYSTWKKNVTFTKPQVAVTSNANIRQNLMYAKGTTGVSEDQLAIVDEFGPELILHADPTTGRLQYLTKGSGVVPHDATVELMKLADLGISGIMDANKFGANVNMISNAINKPEIKLDIENFLNVGRVDQDTLPALEKMMDKKINEFSRQLNYALKGKGVR